MFFFFIFLLFLSLFITIVIKKEKKKDFLRTYAAQNRIMRQIFACIASSGKSVAIVRRFNQGS